MANLRARLPQLLVILLCILMAIWYATLEWEEKEVDLGPTTEARRNPVLALQRLLEQRDQPVELVRGFAGLERLRVGDTPIGAKDALVLLNTGRSLRQSQVDRLWQWLEGGGRLLVAVDNPYLDMTALHSDPLLERLGLTLEETAWDDHEEGEDESEDETDENEAVAKTSATAEDDEKEQDADTKPRDHCIRQHMILPVVLDRHAGSAPTMEFVSEMSFAELDSSVRALASHQDKLFLVHQEVGDGHVYALPSMRVLSNTYIHCQDNAYILWQLLRDSDKVWLVLNADSPSFWRHLWQLSAFGCIALLCALALWLWYKVPRFGPVLKRRITGRRQFLDHISASAQFLIRQQGKDALIPPLRDEILHRLRLRQPGFSHLSRDEQIAKVAQLSGMKNADVEVALYRPLPVPDPIFIDVVQRLQHLRNVL